MHAFLDAFDALQDLVVSAQDEYDRVTVGSLPVGDSMVIAPGPGAPINTDLSLHGDLDIDFVLNAKHRDQRAVIRALVNVHLTLSTLQELPSGKGWQILSVTTSSTPTFIEHDGDQFLYGSGLRVLLYLD